MHIKHIKKARKSGKVSKLKDKAKRAEKEVRRSRLVQKMEKEGDTNYVTLVRTTNEGQVRTRHELHSLPGVLNNLNNV